MGRRFESCPPVGDGYQQRSHCCCRLEPRSDFGSRSASATATDEMHVIHPKSDQVTMGKYGFMVLMRTQVSCQILID